MAFASYLTDEEMEQEEGMVQAPGSAGAELSPVHVMPSREGAPEGCGGCLGLGALSRPMPIAGCASRLPRKAPKAASVTSELAAIHQY